MHSESRSSIFENNFDLIRLFAATQVAVKHAFVHLEVDSYYVEILNVLPGVPIFFFVSGYLIFQSYCNSKSLKMFIINRLLRIYPALIFCFLVTTAIIVKTGYLQLSDLVTKKFAIWLLAQLTFFQFYNPEYLRSFGVGVANGSLWTISVELQFYIITPILFYLVSKRSWVWLALIAIFIFPNAYLLIGEGQSIYYKLFQASFAPWIYMFMLGAWLSTRQDVLAWILKLRLELLTLAYIVIEIVGSVIGIRVTGNEINILSFIFLVSLIIKLAYTSPDLANKVLRRNDISYGIYIYHMPIVNALIVYKLIGSVFYIFLTLVMTFALAVISWLFIEKPSLSLKRVALRHY